MMTKAIKGCVSIGMKHYFGCRNAWQIACYEDIVPNEHAFCHVVVTTMAAVHYNRLLIHEKSLQISAYIAETKRKPKLILVLRDWSKGNRYNISSMLVEYEYDAWPREQCLDLIDHCLARHERGDMCTEDEMWIRPLYYVGKKRFTTLEAASEQSSVTGLPIAIDFTPPYRCMYACEVSQHCEQFAVYKMKEDENMKRFEVWKGDYMYFLFVTESICDAGFSFRVDLTPEETWSIRKQ